MSKTNYSERQKKMRQLLETEADKIGAETKFVQRRSKMTAARFCQTMVLGSLEGTEKSLTGLAQVSQELGVEISTSGLNQRMNQEAVSLLKRLLGQSISLKLPHVKSEALLSQFSDVQLIDSSYMSLPKALQEQFPGLGKNEAAGLKLFLNYSYRYGQIRALEVTAGRTADQSHRIHLEHAQQGSLSMFDLGFFKQEIFQEFSDQQAYFIIRYQNQTALYDHQETRFHVLDYLKRYQGQALDLSLLIGSKVKTPIRLIALRLPTEVAAQRRRKAKEQAKADGRRPTPSAERLALLDWAIFVTNVPTEMLSVEQIVTVYRLRWQIELLFKLWKSQAKLKMIGNFRLARVLCQLFARLIALVLFHFLISPTYALHKDTSLTKAFSVVKRQVSRLIDGFAGHLKQFNNALQRIDDGLQRLAKIDKRKTTPNTYQLLLAAGL